MKYGYHITSKMNIKSILLEGLVPSIGKNSIYIHESKLATYFTTLNDVHKWIERLNLDKNKIIILKFPCYNYNERYDFSLHYFIDYLIPSEYISVVSENEESLYSYYLRNKEQLDLEEEKNILQFIKINLQRLDEINQNDLKPERYPVYNEVEPDIIQTIELLKLIRIYVNKAKYKDIILEIRNRTLKKLLENNLNITYDSEIYQTLYMLFNDSLSNEPQLDFLIINYLIIVLRINLVYRQIDRFCRTNKRYYDDTKWDFSTIEKDKIKKCFMCNGSLINLFDETEELYQKHIKRI